MVAERGIKQNFLYCLYYNLATTFPKQVIIFSPIRVWSYFFFWNLIFGDMLFLLCQEILVSQQVPAVVGSFKVSNNLNLEARLTLSVFPYSRVLIHEGLYAWAPWALTFTSMRLCAFLTHFLAWNNKGTVFWLLQMRHVVESAKTVSTPQRNLLCRHSLWWA